MHTALGEVCLSLFDPWPGRFGMPEVENKEHRTGYAERGVG